MSFLELSLLTNKYVFDQLWEFNQNSKSNVGKLVVYLKVNNKIAQSKLRAFADALCVHTHTHTSKVHTGT